MRKAQSNERTRTIQRLEKVLQDAGIKLTSVASQTYSKSARAMLEALLGGVTDPEQLAELAKARMRWKIPQLKEALANRFDVAHHGVLVAQLLAHIDSLDIAIATLDARIALMLEEHQAVIERLCTIPGVAERTAQVMIAECGLDMARFPTVGHFASWAGMCPGHHESAGRRRSGRTRPGPRWLTEALTESAKAAARRAPTWPPITPRSAGAAARPRRSGRPATTSSSPTSTSSATRSSSASSAPTGSASANPPSAAPGVYSARSKRSATRSPSSPARRPPPPAERDNLDARALTVAAPGDRKPLPMSERRDGDSHLRPWPYHRISSQGERRQDPAEDDELPTARQPSMLGSLVGRNGRSRFYSRRGAATASTVSRSTASANAIV